MIGNSKMGVFSHILVSKMFRLFSIFLMIFVSTNASQPRCGYDSCPKPKVSVPQIYSFYKGKGIKSLLAYFRREC